MALTMTTDAAFAADVLTSPIPVLVDFTADWCPPCKTVAPVLEQIAIEHAGRLRIVSLDVDANPLTPANYGVLSLPTLALFINGQVVSQTIGARPGVAIMREVEPHLNSAR
jgi:thioredoxin 1